MSMSQEALQKLLLEMEEQLTSNQKELSLASSNLSKLIQQTRVLTLQISEINASKVGHVWQSCGKTFIKAKTATHLKKLEDEIKENNEMCKSLRKKKEYLETSIERTYEHMSRYINPADVAAK